MVKFLVVVSILTISIFANLQEKIESYISTQKYTEQENLIKVLFRDSGSFYRVSDGNVDSLKVIKVLEDNGLFNLSFAAPVSLKVKFETQKNPLIFMKVVRESLESIGYNYFLTTRAIKEGDEFVWSIVLRTKYLIDPILFAKELEKRGCQIDDIDKGSDNLWTYKIDSNGAKLDAMSIESDSVVSLKKPIEPYMIYSRDATSIRIKTSLTDHWYPSIVFLDSALHVISHIKIDERKYSLKLDIPRSSRYIRIGDMYTLENIKHGLSIYLKSGTQQ